MWQLRKNCETGLFYHHRIDNTPDKIDFDLVSGYVKASCELLEFLADVRDNTVYRGIPEDIQQAIDTMCQSVYGGF